MDVIEVQKAIEEKFKDTASKEEIGGLSTKLGEVEKTLKEQGEEFTKLIEKFGRKDTVEDELSKFLEDNKDEIKKIYSSGSGVIEFVPKAVGSITTSSGTVVGAPVTNNDTMLPNNMNLNTYNDVLRLVTNFQTSQASYPYTEAKPKEGGFEWVLQGAAKPQIDFSWVTKWAEPKKAAAWIRLTEESIKDVKGLNSLAQNYLKQAHDIFKAKAIIAAAIDASHTFVAGALANAIVTPHFMNVVGAGVVSVATTHSYVDEVSFVPNTVMINPLDFFTDFVCAKDSQGRDLFPYANVFGNVRIGNTIIMSSELITQGEILIADMSKLNTSSYMPYSVKIGWVNDDFIKNQFVMLGESRYHLFVKTHEEGAFLSDDYAVIKAAITKP